MAINSLSLDKQYSDNNVLGETKLDAIFGSVSEWSNIIRGKIPDKTDSTEIITGIWTLTTPKITGTGTGVVTLQYANSADNRTLTIPDPGANDSLECLTNTATLTNKTFTTVTFSGTTVFSGSQTFNSASVSDPTLTGTVTLPGTDPPPAANALTHLGGIKAWGRVDASGNKVNGYNFSSSFLSLGEYRLTWDRDFVDANYAILFTTVGAVTAIMLTNNFEKYSDHVDTFTFNAAGSLANAAFTFIAIGVQ